MKKILIILIILVVVVGVGLGIAMLLAQKQQSPTFCTADAKLCSDGSYVGRTAPDCKFKACPKENLIAVESPQAYETIKSPLTVRGSARGNWYFEATFPLELLDGEGNVLASHYTQAKSDWMTTEFVPFESVLNFVTPLTPTGTLVLKKDNPSGLPEYDDELRIPVTFAQGTRTVKVYDYDPDLDKDESGNIMCSRDGLVATEREIPVTQTPIQDTIKLLLSDLKEELEGVSLKGASLKDGVLTLEFDDPNFKTSGGSCRAGILWFQFEATASQFPGIREVRFLPEELFQP